jgi:hypothetical protein
MDSRFCSVWLLRVSVAETIGVVSLVIQAVGVRSSRLIAVDEALAARPHGGTAERLTSAPKLSWAGARQVVVDRVRHALGGAEGVKWHHNP